MTTTAHEDQFAPEPVDINSEDIRNAALEEAAKFIENGSFLHDQSPPKLFANEVAPAIRALKSQPHNAVAGIYKNIRGHRGIE